jgi:hypothetical protein
MAKDSTVGPVPTASKILVLLRQAQNEWRARDTIIRMMRRLRFLEQPVEIPAGYKATATEVRVPAAMEIGWRITGTLASGTRTIQVPPASRNPEDQETASNLETWSTESYRMMAKRQGRDTFTMVTDQQVNDGMGVAKMLLRPDSWYAYPKRRKDEEPEDFLKRSERWKLSASFPIWFRDVDPITVYPIEGGDGVEAVIEISYRSRRVLDSKYPNTVGPDGKIRPRALSAPQSFLPNSYIPSSTSTSGIYSPVDRFIEYWEAPEAGKEWGWAAYMVGDEIVKVFKHRYGRVPYFFVRGQQTSSSVKAYQSLPILFPYYWGILGLNALLTMKMNASFLWAYPIPYVTTPGSASYTVDQAVQKLEPNKMWTGQPGQTIGFLSNPGTVVDLDETIGYLQNQLDRLLAPVLYGIGGAQQPGYSISQLQNAAMTLFRPITDNLEMFGEEVTSHLWKLVELWDDEVYLPVPDGRKRKKLLSIGPDTIDGYYMNNWKVSALLPADKMARGSWAAQLYQAELVSKRWAIEEGLGEHNPEEMVKERQIEDWMASPQVAAMQLAKFLQQAGFLPPNSVPNVGGGGSPTPGVSGSMSGTPGRGGGGTLPPNAKATPSQAPRKRGRPAGVGRAAPQPKRA